MVSNYPHRLTPADERVIDRGEAQPDGVMSWLLARLGRLVCGFRGHDEVLHFENHRVQLRCASCGHDSPGWDIGQHPPRLRFQGDARRHALLTPATRAQAVLVRKTA